MSIRSMVRDYFDKTADARFKHDAQGRLVFFPWGFGSGRIVPDAAIEAQLRRASRNLVIGILLVVVPAIAIFNVIYNPTGLKFLGYLAACTALGFLGQFYLVLLSRDLPRSEESMSYSAAMTESLDRFGKKFLISGLAMSMLFTVGAALMMLFPSAGPSPDKIAMLTCVLIFAPMTVLYAWALRRKIKA